MKPFGPHSILLLASTLAPFLLCSDPAAGSEESDPLRPPQFDQDEVPAGLPVAEGWLTQVSANLARDEYQFSLLAPELWSAPNRAHGLRSRVGRDGIEVFAQATDSGGEDADWRLKLETVGFGRVGHVRPLACRRVSVSGERAELDHGLLLEWFINDERGIEQGWTIEERPAGDEPLVIRLCVTGPLSLRLDQGGGSASFVTSAGEPRLSYRDVVAWDSTGRGLEVELWSAPAGLELLVDDQGASYPITVDPLILNESWSVHSDQVLAWLGRSVSAAGDVNGDGYPDVIIGAPRYDNGEDEEGRAYLYLGSAAGLSTTAAWIVESNHVDAHFGSSVSDAGDVNGDGFDDVIVGARYYDNGLFRQGRAYVYLGSAAGLSQTEAWSAESTQIFGEFGTSVSSAGDVNGDGYDDVIVGGGRRNQSAGVWVFHGSASGPSPAPDWIGSSSQLDTGYGSSVSSAGDVNADGYADIIVGQYEYSNGESEEGRAYVYLGSATGLATTEAWAAESNQVDAWFGWAVSDAGDIDGDGYADVVLGAPNFNFGGRAFVYHGSATGTHPTPAWTADPGNKLNAQFGKSVSSAGDFNGDGYSDVIIGSLRYARGRAFVYLGTPTGLDPRAALIAVADPVASAPGFSWSVSEAGDIDQDGYSDILVGDYNFNPGAPVVGVAGRALLYSGFDISPLGPLCPAGVSANGCSAHLTQEGNASATSPVGFVLTTTTVEGRRIGMYIFSPAPGIKLPWGNGTSFTCVGAPVSRGGLLPSSGTSGACDGAFSEDLNALWCSTCPKPGLNPGPGVVVQAQLWYRDPGNTSNQTTSLSDSVEILVGP